MRLVITLVMTCVSGLAIGADYLPVNSTASGKEMVAPRWEQSVTGARDHR